MSDYYNAPANQSRRVRAPAVRRRARPVPLYSLKAYAQTLLEKETSDRQRLSSLPPEARAVPATPLSVRRLQAGPPPTFRRRRACPDPVWPPCPRPWREFAAAKAPFDEKRRRLRHDFAAEDFAKLATLPPPNCSCSSRRNPAPATPRFFLLRAGGTPVAEYSSHRQAGITFHRRLHHADAGRAGGWTHITATYDGASSRSTRMACCGRKPAGSYRRAERIEGALVHRS